MRHTLKAVDLFCGAGGLTEGLRQAGYRVIGAVDIDPFACRTYRLNHRRVKVWQIDISRLSGPAIMKALALRPGELDLLAACPPCQGFSAMRTRNGSHRNRDPRNDLIHEVLRITRSTKPKSIMLENVPGLALSRRYRNFRKGLESLGYHVKWDILNTVDFAVPQRRRWLVLLASRASHPEFPARVSYHRTVRQSIGKLAPPSRSRDPLHHYPIRHSTRVREFIRMIPRDGGAERPLGNSTNWSATSAWMASRTCTGEWPGTNQPQRLLADVLTHPRDDSSTPERTGL